MTWLSRRRSTSASSASLAAASTAAEMHSFRCSRTSSLEAKVTTARQSPSREDDLGVVDGRLRRRGRGEALLQGIRPDQLADERRLTGTRRSKEEHPPVPVRSRLGQRNDGLAQRREVGLLGHHLVEENLDDARIESPLGLGPSGGIVIPRIAQKNVQLAPEPLGLRLVPRA